MMPSLFTSVGVPQLPFSLSVGDAILSLGSCFADEVGQRMSNAGFNVANNPFGTLYNPASIAAALRRLLTDEPLVESDLSERDGLWHSWHHHGSFSRPSHDDCLYACNAAIHHGHQALASASLLMITFGTAWVYELQRDAKPPMIVANCHKFPSSCFVRRCLSVDEVLNLWKPLLPALSAFNPKLKTLFTVSPIRHMADGAHGNQISKATLLLATEQLGVPYFPAYEILLDELRDYRFYASDMCHPSPVAVDVVWDRFKQACMSPATRQLAHNISKQKKRSAHIPLHDGSSQRH